MRDTSRASRESSLKCEFGMCRVGGTRVREQIYSRTALESWTVCLTDLSMEYAYEKADQTAAGCRTLLIMCTC